MIFTRDPADLESTPIHRFSRSTASWLARLLAIPLVVVVLTAARLAPGGDLPASGLFARTNLVAWCIVPFDTRHRGPEERAAMLDRLGIRRLAYDWRAEHVASFQAEISALKAHQIELTAWWFPATLNDEARTILQVLRSNRLNPQLWVTMGTEPEMDPARLAQKIDQAVTNLAEVCSAAARVGCIVGLYNHLGWFGEPTNQLAIINRLRAEGHLNVGMVYNFHHGHAHIDQFPEIIRLISRHLIAVNLNGMVRDGERLGKKIIPLGTGDQELAMLRTLQLSGWTGPVGIIGHTEEDAEVKLRKELTGLEQLVPRLGQAPEPKPPPSPEKNEPPAKKTQAVISPAEGFAPVLVPGRFATALNARVHPLVTAAPAEVRHPPLLVEAWVNLAAKKDFNIIAASEIKSSATHWELFTYEATGELSFHSPSMTPPEIKSGVGVCDGRWHLVAAFFGRSEVRLFVDGKVVAQRPVQRSVEPTAGTVQFGIGRLVEGGLGCQGLIEAVRVSGRLRGGERFGRERLNSDADTHAFWSFESLAQLERWAALASSAAPSGNASFPVADALPIARPVNRNEPWKQSESDWVDDRWNRTRLDRWQAYLLPTPTGTIRKGLAIQLGAQRKGAVAYDTATGQWRAAWTGGFLQFQPARFGLIQPPRPAGEVILSLPESAGWTGASVAWQGFAVQEERVILEYSVGDLFVRESPWVFTHRGVTLWTRDFEWVASRKTEAQLKLLVGATNTAVDLTEDGLPCYGFREDGKIRAVALQSHSGVRLFRSSPSDAVVLASGQHEGTTRARAYYFLDSESRLPALREALRNPEEPANLAAMVVEARGPAAEPIPARGQLGTGNDAYVIDTIPVPYENPWNALLFCSGVGFFDNGDAAISTIHGDVWRVSGLDDSLQNVAWRRIASGLFQPLGLTVVSNSVIVLGRDYLTRLQDFDGDGCTDYYETVSRLIETSAAGHDFVTSLCCDAAGHFYYVDPKGAHRLSPDGKEGTILARGFRNPNGMGVNPEGTIVTVAPQQGEWTPSSVIHELRADGWYGYGGPRVAETRPLGYDPPLCWIPHRIDNASGSQVWAVSDRFGPLTGHLLHLSWGRCSWLLTLRDVVDGQPQGAVVPLKGRFLSGPMRGAFSPRDGQLYIVGCQGWQTAAVRDGSFQRVRWTRKPFPMPVDWQAQEGALVLRFQEPLDRETAEDPDSYGLEAWNYRYAAQYGSKDWSVKTPAREGHDTWRVTAATLDADSRTVTLRVPELQPVMQFALKYNLDTLERKPTTGELYGTIHRLHQRQPLSN